MRWLDEVRGNETLKQAAIALFHEEGLTSEVEGSSLIKEENHDHTDRNKKRRTADRRTS